MPAQFRGRSLTDEEFASLKKVGEGHGHVVPGNHKDRLIDLGYITDNLELTEAGRTRLAAEQNRPQRP